MLKPRVISHLSLCFHDLGLDFSYNRPSINFWLLKQRLSFVSSNFLITLFSLRAPLGSWSIWPCCCLKLPFREWNLVPETQTYSFDFHWTPFFFSYFAFLAGLSWRKGKKGRMKEEDGVGSEREKMKERKTEGIKWEEEEEELKCKRENVDSLCYMSFLFVINLKRKTTDLKDEKMQASMSRK